MMQDIHQNGPITAQFMVMASFESFDFTTGKVYKPNPGELIPLGGHAIKILGYGNQDGEAYWLIANSWNEDWGDKGFFKMIRGVNTGPPRSMVALSQATPRRRSPSESPS